MPEGTILPVRNESRPARTAPIIGSPAAPMNSSKLKVHIVDLNNFASFPTLAIGILVASLRSAGHDVQVMCPLAYNVPASFRERREGWRDALLRRVNLSTRPSFGLARKVAADARHLWANRPNRKMLSEIEHAFSERADIVLLSAYLQQYPMVQAIGQLAEDYGLPLLLGGPMFNISGVADAWLSTPGLAAIFGGEADLIASDLVEAVCSGGNLLAFPGITLPDGRRSEAATPLRKLDAAMTPDFTDFPWDRYPFRVVPMMTGRGCQWAKCTFCSDVVTANGRTFRTRSAESVLTEMREQARRHQTSNFLFIDIKLNSNPNMLRSIAEHAQTYVPGAEWIGTVHVDQRADNGLSRRELRAAVAGGMRRVSFGLESGSQRLLDEMQKGSLVERNSEFIRNAHESGLSIRCTMFTGFPGEIADDLDLTAAFLEEHAPYLDRVRFNRFSIIPETPIFEAVLARSPESKAVRLIDPNYRLAKARYANSETGNRHYRKAKARVIKAVEAINRKEIRRAARAFDGMM